MELVIALILILYLGGIGVMLLIWPRLRHPVQVLREVGGLVDELLSVYEPERP